jgi:CubicO group peptidase (beta-lactamase class C family)
MNLTGYTRCLCTLGLSISLGAAAVAPPAPAADPVAALHADIEQILHDTHVPGASVAWVAADGRSGTDGVGWADVAARTPSNATTLFPIGSVSKGLTALALLQLVEAGRVRLDAPVTAYVGPEWFVNPYESAVPTTVADLLEHTTGWDDLHLREYAKDAVGMTLEEGLRFDRSSRVARWEPGTRMAYCNSGPAVAALIVERLTGERIEDYVRDHLFAPIGMTTATYAEPVGRSRATLYHDDGRTPFAYWHILLRPAGSIYASAEDMAAYLHFYLGRGRVGEQRVLSPGGLTRMETPTRAWSAQAGLTTGYGLANYTSIEDGFVFHGHDGGVQGGLARLRYLPEAGAGYAVVINASNPEALKRIGDRLRSWVLRGVPRPAVPPAGPMPTDAGAYSGWFRLDSPRQQSDAFALRLVDWRHVSVDADGLTIRPLLGGATQRYLPVAGRTFRTVDEPVATLAYATPQPSRRVLLQGTGTYVQVAPWQVALEWAGVAWSLLGAAVSLLYGAVAGIAALVGRRRREDRPIRVALVLSAVSLCAFVLLPGLAGDDVIERLGHATAWSVGLCATTVVYALAVLWSVATVVWPRRGARRWVVLLGRGIAAGQLLTLAYLAAWGVIGLRTWT